MPLNLDTYNTMTRIHIAPGLIDNYFKGGAVMKMLRQQRYKTFPGGLGFQENFVFAPPKAGSFRMGGESFDLTRRQTETGLRHNLVLYYANVSQDLVELNLWLTQAETMFSRVKTDMALAGLALSQVLENDVMHHGSAQVGDDRSDKIKGFPEALNDGTTASYEGFTHPVYGGQTRTDAALNSAMLPAGSNANALIPMNVNGPPTNKFLERSYTSCCVGDEEPKFGITTRHCLSLIKEQQLPLKPLPDTMDQKLGISGIQWQKAIITASDYMPGTQGANQANNVNYLTSTTTGETFIWVNPGGEGDEAYFRMWFPRSPLLQFGFTGFKPSQGSTQIAGQILVACQLSVRSFRTMRMHYGLKAPGA